MSVASIVVIVQTLHVGRIGNAHRGGRVYFSIGERKASPSVVAGDVIVVLAVDVPWPAEGR